MTNPVNVALETKIQVLDDDGDADTGAIVSYIVYDEADAPFQNGNMTHFANGIYTISFTPDAAGEWTCYTYSAAPKFKISFTYTII